MFKTIIQNLCVLRNKIISKDDFTWKRYHTNYSNQIKKSEEDHTLKLTNDFHIEDGKIEFTCDLPLYKNHEILYKVIYDLHPSSIFEIGCGGGDHMFNLLKIMPEIEIKGCDLLQKQLDFLNERSPKLKGKTIVHDITKEPVPVFYDLIYTQAVIMHVQKDNNHLKALRNLFMSSTDYIVLMENWNRHNFYEDIKTISKERFFPWKDLHLYKFDDGKQIIMVLSDGPIKDKKLNYVELKSNEEMLKYL